MDWSKLGVLCMNVIERKGGLSGRSRQKDYCFVSIPTNVATHVKIDRTQRDPCNTQPTSSGSPGPAFTSSGFV